MIGENSGHLKEIIDSAGDENAVKTIEDNPQAEYLNEIIHSAGDEDAVRAIEDNLSKSDKTD